MKVKPPPAAPPKPHSRAWFAFEENLDQVVHFTSLGRAQADLMLKEAARLAAFLKKPRGNTKAETAKVIRAGQRYVDGLSARVGPYKTVTLWQLVILITCLEAYLQDVLVGAASVDPELMSDSKQNADYVDVVAAASLEELAKGMRVRWARNWLRNGGPHDWIKRLKKMGARGFPSDLGDRLAMWRDVRHAVVHSAGVIDEAFVKRHPTVGKKAGDRLGAASSDVKKLIEATKDFLDPTEEFFLKRYPALIYTAPPEPVARALAGVEKSDTVTRG